MEDIIAPSDLRRAGFPAYFSFCVSFTFLHSISVQQPCSVDADKVFELDEKYRAGVPSKNPTTDCQLFVEYCIFITLPTLVLILKRIGICVGKNSAFLF